MKASSLLQIATTVAILPLASAETNSNNHTPLRHSHNSNNNNNNNKHPSRHSNNRRRATTEYGPQQQQQSQSQRNLEVSSSTQDEQSHMHSVTNQQWADLSSIFSQADFSLTPPQSPIKKSSLVDDDEEVADKEEDATEREATTPTWVCNYNEACPELGSQCMRGFETCFGRTYHSFLCDCVEKEDDSGDLIYSCEVTEACAKLSTTSVASDDTEKSVSAAGGGGSRSKSGKSSKSSKSSKSAKSTYHATSSSSSSSMSTDASADVGNNGGGDPMAAAYTKSGKSSKSKSSKSSKYLKSSKSSKAKYQYAEKVIDTPITTDTTPKSTPSSVTSPDSTSQSTEGGSTTADPTMQPSAITLRVASTPIVSAAAEPCSGQPCPFDSWCRSRYGSCGPGYAYCNSNSIWMESCNDDESSSSSSSSTTDKPTKKPTRVRDGTSNFIAGVNIRDFPEVSSSQDTAALMENVNYLGREEETVSVHGAGGAGGGTGDGAPGARMAIGMAVGLTAATLLGMGWALVIKGYYVRNLGRPPVGAREVTDVGGALGAGVATPELL